MKPAILHIGQQKTGTSAIQSWLSENASDLARIGWAYPREFTLEGFDLNPLSAAVCTAPEKRVPVQTDKVEAFSTWLNSIDSANLIYSSEFLNGQAMRSEPFGRFVSFLRDHGFDPRALLVLRNPIDFVNSAFNQMQKTLKGAHVKQLMDEVVVARRYRWERVLEGLQENACPVELGVYPPAGGSKALISDFLRLAKIDDKIMSAFIEPQREKNTSLGRVGLVAATHLIGAFWDRLQNERMQISYVLSDTLQTVHEAPVRVYTDAQLDEMQTVLKQKMAHVRPFITEEEYARLSQCHSAKFDLVPNSFDDLAHDEQDRVRHVLQEVGDKLDASPHFAQLGIRSDRIHAHPFGDDILKSPFVAKADHLQVQRVSGKA